MIQILQPIEYMDSRRVPITPTYKRVMVEVVSNRRIDMAIVTSKQFKEFQNADEDFDEWSFEWVEGLNWNDFTVEHVAEPLSLLVWNSNEDEPAVVAYKFTDLTAAPRSEPMAVTS